MLQSCSEFCHPSAAKKMRDTIVFLQNLGSEDLLNIPWLPQHLWLAASCFNRYDGSIHYNPIATDSIKYLYYYAIETENRSHPLLEVSSIVAFVIAANITFWLNTIMT
jgi:undecaprenyl pyrophosphate synthase